MLYSSFKIKELEFKNRWIMLAVHMGYADGNAINEREFAFYEERARGGAAAVTMVLAVNEAGSLKGMHQAQALDIESLTDLVERMHEHGCKLIVQLFHCGGNANEKNHENMSLFAPSSVKISQDTLLPIDMDETELLKTKQDFIFAANLCKKAGVDAIEVNASEGYLLSEFFSPITNLREDLYGYKTQRGMTYPLEILNAIREEASNYPIILKISAGQMMEGGYDLENMIAFCNLASQHIDAVSVTGGWSHSQMEDILYYIPKGAYATLVGVMKKFVSFPIIACKNIYDGEVAEKILMQNQGDLIGTARGFLADAQFANRIKNKELFLPCQGCNHCMNALLDGKSLICGFNPEVGQEFFEKQRRSIATRKEVVVVGSGPAGMQAAKKSAERGFVTTLITEEMTLGGKFNLAAKPPKKEAIQKYIEYMEKTLNTLGVKIIFGEKCKEAFLIEKKPYFTVIATGSKPNKLEIEGGERAIFADDILSVRVCLPEQTKQGQIVIVGGNGIGIEMAAYLKGLSEERKITVIEEKGHFGQDLGPLAKPLVKFLRAKEVEFMANATVQRIEDGNVVISINKETFTLQVDAVILTTGYKACDYSYLTMPLMDERLSYAVVGDAGQIENGIAAIQSAYELFTRLYLA